MSAEAPPSLTWLIFGCGGVGGYFGARVAKCPGQKVSFMVRNQALAALKEHGVRIQSICGDVTVPTSELGPILDTGALDKEAKFEADVIMLGCKAWEAERCLKMCEPWCGKDTVVLPLQNGVEGLSTIRDTVAAWGKGHALAGCCNIVSAIKEPGFIKHWAANPPYITYGEFEGSTVAKTEQVKQVLDACCGMEGHFEEDVLSKIWEKFAFICTTTGVQATNGPHATQDVIPCVPELLHTWTAGMQEIIALCRSYGIKYDDAHLEKRIELLKVSKGATTSCSRDLWAGKPSEVDDLLGSVVRLGKEQGVATPVITTLYSSLILRDRIARGDGKECVVPEGEKIMGPQWQKPVDHPPEKKAKLAA
jgi:2-dehydropantoate 2-reductase